ncbi:hypothetical protein [Streptomyces sp. WMMB303]|uniref:hypothetical protein n=1 Tax=Streptomyces sp. WMMB303 TaxID=3034154 RepID=UPI0023ED4BC3|nr:hypothetical protein [Streptomyces sp. WMMB303]MDF4254567.1 hypothetical protein [Streptomyces sp. WMMB303]
MVRGRADSKRTHCVSVRLNAEELARWQKARQQTERKELGAWVRAVVEESLNGHPGVPGDIPRVPEINETAYAQLVNAAEELRGLIHLAREEGTLPAAADATLTRLGNAALHVRGLPAAPENTAGQQR